MPIVNDIFHILSIWLMCYKGEMYIHNDVLSSSVRQLSIFLFMAEKTQGTPDLK